jgi:flavin-binding protein dodecin
MNVGGDSSAIGAGHAAQQDKSIDDAIDRARSRGVAAANRGSWVHSLSTRRRRMIDNALAQAESVSEVVVFRNGHASLRIERGANGTFDLVLSAHGEEVTAYDLTADAVATIGTKLVAAAWA